MISPPTLLPTVWPFLKAHWRPVVVCIALLVAVGAGRFLVPTKTAIMTVQKTVYKDRIVTQTVQSEAKTVEHVVYRDHTTVVYKDGTVEHRDIVKTENATGDKTVTKSSKAVEQTQEAFKSATKEVTNAKPQWRVNLLAGVETFNLKAPQLLGPVALGVQVERRLIGPVWIGAFGLSSGSAGLSVGVEF